MKCPHCSNTVGFSQICKFDLSFAGNRQKDEELLCPSCNHRIYWSFRPAILFPGILLAMWGLSELDRVLMQAAWLIPAYIFSSVVLIGVSAFYLRNKPNMLFHMRRSVAYRFYFLSSYFLLSMIVIQICFLYTNFIPAIQALKEINGTIAGMHRYKSGMPEYIVLDKTGPTIRYYFHFDDDYKSIWPNVESIKPDTKIHILADESISITEDAYRVWEMATESETIISYESMRKIRAADAKAENIQGAKISLVFLLLYFVSLYFKRKADLTN